MQHKISSSGNLGSSRVKSGHSFGDVALQTFQQVSHHGLYHIIFFQSGVKFSSDTKEFTVSIPGKGNAVFNMEKKVKT